MTDRQHPAAPSGPAPGVPRPVRTPLRWRFGDWPLRAKVAVVLGIALLFPLLATLSSEVQKNKVVEDLGAALGARADQLCGSLDLFHRGYQSAAARLARSPVVVACCEADGPEAARLFPELRAMLDLQPMGGGDIRGAGILDLSGKVLFATEAALIGSDLSAHAWVRDALVGAPVVSDVHLAEPAVGQVPTIAYAAPVLAADGRVLGLAAYWVRASTLWELARNGNGLAGPGSFAVVLDRHGIRVADTFSEELAPRPAGELDPATVEALVAEQRFGERTRELLAAVQPMPVPFAAARSELPDRGVFRGYAPVNGKWNYGVARRLQAVPWTVFTMLPEDSVVAAIAAIGRDRTVFACLILIVAGIVGALFSALVLRPIRSLSRATAALAAGDLGARVPGGRSDELGMLGATFNAMAGQIQAQDAALRTARDELDRRVQERTADLARTTDALRESEQSLATTLDSIGDAVIATDLEGRVVRMNPVAEAMTGWPMAHARGRPLPEVFRILNEETREPVESPVDRVLREGVVVGLANHTALLARDGRERPIADSGAPIRSAQGAIRGVVLVFRDQTEERLAEQERARSHGLQLESHRVQAASRLKSEFLANMSHELRTPLNAIIGFAQLLHDERIKPGRPEFKDALGDILSSGRHLLQLINDVLDLSKVEAGMMQFRPEPVDLSLLVAEVLGILRTLVADKGLVVDFHVDLDLVGVELDAARFKQLLYNFVSNAIKFTPESGRIQVRVLSQPDTSVFRLEVEDSGIGIAPEDLPRLFTEFQQLDAGAGKRHGGTGLGLALTKRLVEAQGGSVGVASVPGEGSTFHAMLPRRSRAGRPMPALIAPAAAGARGPHVLVVDDNDRDQAVLVRTLSDAGYTVDAAATGAQAVAMCAVRAYDAITLDMLLPDMSGMDVLAAIRAGVGHRDVPVIVVTVVTERGAVAGYAVHDLLPKPLDGDALLQSLGRAGLVPLRPGKVLVVDDDAGSRNLVSASLTRLGYGVVCAPGGAEGLAACAAETPLAVILDLLMPGMNGFQFLDRFRELAACRRVPVIVWSAKDLTPEEGERLRAGVQAVLSKDGTLHGSVVEELRALLAPARAAGAALAVGGTQAVGSGAAS